MTTDSNTAHKTKKNRLLPNHRPSGFYSFAKLILIMILQIYNAVYHYAQMRFWIFTPIAKTESNFDNSYVL